MFMVLIGAILLVLGFYILHEKKIPFVRNYEGICNIEGYCKINGYIVIAFGLVILIGTVVGLPEYILVLVGIVLTLIDFWFVTKKCM
ncbi:MAG: hypothetical protein R3Y47_04220 [Lachnospiraceae bacterium]